MNLAVEADKIRYIVTGEGGLDLSAETDLSVRDAVDRIARTQRDGDNPAAVTISPQQKHDWCMDLRTATLDYLIGIPLIVRWS